MRHYLLRVLMLFAMACGFSVPAMASTDLFKGGHAKYLLLVNTFPDDSLFRDFIDRENYLWNFDQSNDFLGISVAINDS